jgi:hypothetical protein
MKFDDAILITEDGTIITLNLPATREHFAEYAAAVLRCTTIETFDLDADVVIWVDEEGRGRWGYNALVDALLNRYGFTDSLHGPALITGYGAHVKALPGETVDRILRELSDISD